MNIRLSVVVSTYNAFPHDLSALDEKLAADGIELEVIYVNDPYGPYHKQDMKGGRMRVITPPSGLGYFNSMRYGLLQTTGEFVYFLSADAKLNDLSFFTRGVKELLNGADLVFSRSEVSSEMSSYIMQHPFKDSYSPAEFLREWYNLRMTFVDYFSFSSFIFIKDLLMKAEAFISEFPDALSLDTATLLKVPLICEKISFVDCVAVTRRYSENQYNHNDKSNMTDQVVNHFAIPIDIANFIKKLDLDRELQNELKVFFNQYAMYSFNAITSDFYQTSNRLIFDCLELKQTLKGKKVWIYGHGWVGLALAEYMKEQNISVSGFIDDFKTGKSIMSFESFNTAQHENTAVIIASYKCADVFRIYKKLCQVGGLEIIDLMIQ